jgi:sulfur transfer protein SufE
LAEHLTPQRSNGFASMVERIYTELPPRHERRGETV